jgi:hypothetical protein
MSRLVQPREHAPHPFFRVATTRMPVVRFSIVLLLVQLLNGPIHAQVFYKTPFGKKFHLANCSTVKNVSEEITFGQATKLGLEPCLVCHPETLLSAAVQTTQKAQGQSSTVRCKGLTKAGSQCRHMTRIANGYCFQHQPK